MNNSKFDHLPSESHLRSPRINPNLEARPRRLMGVMQSAQEIPRMHLFNDILTKVISRKREEYMRVFMISLCNNVLTNKPSNSSQYDTNVLYGSVQNQAHIDYANHTMVSISLNLTPSYN
jgi:hypothetical protein